MPIKTMLGIAGASASRGGGGLTPVWAWDGTTTPDVTKIPQGVVVTYNNVEYTGTLVASQSTLGNEYVVYNPNEQQFPYDEYQTLTTTLGTYVWNKMGNIAVSIQGLLSYENVQNLTPEQILRVLANAHAAKAPEVSTTLPATLADGVEYRLGSQSSLALTLPASGEYGIVVSFTASAAFTPTITGTIASAPIPTTVSGKKYRILFDYDGAAWVVSYVTYS